MNAVGIDVSKRKSTVTIRRPGDQVILKPCDFRNTQSGINALIQIIRDLDGETKVCMEHTGRYYEPVARWLSDAGIFVSAVNPILIKQFGNDSLHAPKTDKADARKIARFALDRWPNLKQYGPMDEIRSGLCPYLLACGMRPRQITECFYRALSEMVQTQWLCLQCR